MKKIGLLLLLSSVAIFAQENYSTWAHYKVITLNTTNSGGGANISGAETNFPVLVRLTAANNDVFTGAATGGTDIRFSASDGATPLKFQRDRWDAVNQLAEFWVLLPSVAANSNTTFRIYWGRGGVADSSNGPAVFDTANAFRGVWHLGKGVPGSATVLDSDATVDANHLTWINANTVENTAVVPGEIATADSLPNTNNATTSNFLAASSNNSFVIGSANGMTLSAWVKRVGKGGGTPTNPVSSDEGIAMRFRFTTPANNGRLWGLEYTPNTKGNPASNAGTGNYNTHGNGYSFHYATDGSATTANETFLCSGIVDSGNWDHLVATENGSSQAFWVNGVRVATDAQTTTNLDVANSGTPMAGNAAFTIGKLDSADVTYNQTFNGVIDEVTLSRTIRDSNWIKLSYATEKPSVTALTLGATSGSSVVPTAPLSVSGLAGDGQVAVSWAAPTSNGGAAITGYTATSSPGSFTCTTTGSLSCTVTGLSNGTPYTFTVTATNSVGAGPASTASTAVTPSASAGVPSAPQSVTAKAGNGRDTVSWTAPTSNGSSAITLYTATSNPNAITCTTSGALTCVDSGLTNGTAYTFTVTATNTSGTGVASSPSTAVTPKGSPAPPTGVQGTSGNAQAVLSWTAPANNGGSAITGYTATSVVDTSKHCSTAGLTCTITGLTNGVVYTFVVTATNALGTSLPSVASGAVTPLGPPSAPLSVTAAGGPGDGQITVSWMTPTSIGGAAITAYTVTSAPGGFTCTTNGALTCAVSGLNDATNYTFTVTATNTAGVGPASAASTATSSILSFSKAGFSLQRDGSSMLLQLPQTSGSKRVTILDIWGRTVWSRTLSSQSQELVWSGKSIGGSAAAGVYFLRVAMRNSDGSRGITLQTKFGYEP